MAAAADSRLYLPTRLLPDSYDIPHPYAPAPPARTQALLAAYDTALDATTRSVTALDDLAAAINAPSRALAATHRAAEITRPQDARALRQQASPGQHPASLVPGRTEAALRKLRIRDPALLLRAAVIDQAAHDLLAEATTKARSRASVNARTRRAQYRQGCRLPRSWDRSAGFSATSAGKRQRHHACPNG
jgi:hypothetical protein